MTALSPMKHADRMLSKHRATPTVGKYFNGLIRNLCVELSSWPTLCCVLPTLVHWTWGKSNNQKAFDLFQSEILYVNILVLICTNVLVATLCVGLPMVGSLSDGGGRWHRKCPKFSKDSQALWNLMHLCIHISDLIYVNGLSKKGRSSLPRSREVLS